MLLRALRNQQQYNSSFVCCMLLFSLCLSLSGMALKTLFLKKDIYNRYVAAFPLPVPIFFSPPQF